MNRILKIFFFPQECIRKFSPFFRDSIFAAHNTNKYYFNMVSLMETSFTTMQYTAPERDRFTYLSFVTLMYQTVFIYTMLLGSARSSSLLYFDGCIAFRGDKGDILWHMAFDVSWQEAQKWQRIFNIKKG